MSIINFYRVYPKVNETVILTNRLIELLKTKNELMGAMDERISHLIMSTLTVNGAKHSITYNRDDGRRPSQSLYDELDEYTADLLDETKKLLDKLVMSCLSLEWKEDDNSTE